MQRARGDRLGELVDVLDAGDQVVVIMRPRREGDEPAILVANLTTFRDGKIIEMVHYPDDVLLKPPRKDTPAARET
jgi:ketosteroid isomerase-like protein